MANELWNPVYWEKYFKMSSADTKLSRVTVKYCDQIWHESQIPQGADKARNFTDIRDETLRGLNTLDGFQ